MGGAVTRAEAGMAFERFWPRGLPFPPEAPWLAARMSRRRAGSAYVRVVTDPVMLSRVAQEAGIQLHGGQEVHEDESTAAAVGVGIACAVMLYLLWRATELLPEDEGDEPEDKDSGDTGDTGDTDEGDGGEGGGCGGYWDPDGTLGGGRKPVWA